MNMWLRHGEMEKMAQSCWQKKKVLFSSHALKPLNPVPAPHTAPVAILPERDMAKADTHYLIIRIKYTLSLQN
jgi:hypothetical protein